MAPKLVAAQHKGRAAGLMAIAYQASPVLPGGRNARGMAPVTAVPPCTCVLPLPRSCLGWCFQPVPPGRIDHAPDAGFRPPLPPRPRPTGPAPLQTAHFLGLGLATGLALLLFGSISVE